MLETSVQEKVTFEEKTSCSEGYFIFLLNCDVTAACFAN